MVESPGLILHQHDFENFPFGTKPHTTAPFDYTVAVLAWALKPFTPRFLDLAGAWVSPILGILTGVFLFSWAGRLKVSPWPLLLVYSVSPILVHCTALGRPDHQSLLLFCMAAALGSEWILARKPSRGWALLGGGAWGLGLWVSLYEPLILLVASQVAGLLFLRKRFFNKMRAHAWCAMLATLGLALCIDGLRWDLPRGHDFQKWAATIGEMQPGWRMIFGWVGWWLIPGSCLLLLRPRTRPLFFLFLFSVLLTGWQARWGCFMALLFVLCLPLLLPFARRPALLWSLLIFSLWPVARQWDDLISFRAGQGGKTAENRSLFDAAQFLKGSEGALLAPWWLSPALVYWSGLPSVAGSSHESLPGILESARFFSTNDLDAGGGILKARKVKWVVVSDPVALLGNSIALLGTTNRDDSLANVFYKRPRLAPDYLQLRYANQFFKIYHVDWPQ